MRKTQSKGWKKAALLLSKQGPLSPPQDGFPIAGGYTAACLTSLQGRGKRRVVGCSKAALSPAGSHSRRLALGQDVVAPGGGGSPHGQGVSGTGSCQMLLYRAALLSHRLGTTLGTQTPTLPWDTHPAWPKGACRALEGPISGVP